MPFPSAAKSSAPEPSWWQGAAIYQLYVRSFADGDGDGIGDLAGVRARLPYLAALGIDAIWFNPWYPSPMADAGYDISDYRSIDPVFGTLDDADALIGEAHDHGIRIIVDVVPNHASDRTPGSARRSPPGRAPRRGHGSGSGPAGGRAATAARTTGSRSSAARPGPGSPSRTARRASGTCTCSRPEQPDFNWDSADVRREFEDVLRFWFARGADGIRIDSAALLCKDPDLPDLPPVALPGPAHPFTDRDEVHEIYRAWRAVADEFSAGGQGQRMLIGEVWLADAARLARYVRPGELHTVFNFPYLNCPWDAAGLRGVIDQTLALSAPTGSPATWVLSNHDVDRVVSRYGRPDTAFDLDRRRYFHGLPADLPLGTRRARAAALLTMALPGSVYVYQGEELGLWEVLDLPENLRQDPIWARTGGADPGPRRQPGPAAVVGHRAAVRLLPRRRGVAALAAAAQGVARPDRGGRGRQPRTRCSPCTGRRCASAAPSPPSATRR